MFKSIAVRKSQGTQYIPDLYAAQPGGFRGKPVIADAPCVGGRPVDVIQSDRDNGLQDNDTAHCRACQEVCPSQAITLRPKGADPVAIDLGRCVLCGDCAPACPAGKISFSNDVKICTTRREALTVSAAHPYIEPLRVSAELKKRFGRSLKLRSVSAGGCNGCEMEINAWGNVNFDLGRYGIDIVASPRHADGLVLSGPISRNMMDALHICWDAMPEPKLVIAVGACAISGGVFAQSDALAREFLDKYPPSLYVPGCPAHPLTFISGIMDLLGIKR
ncbi:MAG: 4Fe-4S dicluster domain-containing protein [Rhodoferax sp.]|jgi:Ni,Fe-hydrogenase III small subunit/NAD-dependent dihydropyrimidine dehydrogenase PreA subunit|uniref:NADH-quinone oxidoreductase subunit B family protein n=1 Tax=Rhodoferax sp. TaxID=50421 RepID=UPI001B427075|nr:4Fe-4S dicluster domain-containing protein [Rhodoferax sp.]MBP9149395.1 4Fe-4S dicluster domain-containing protein [Rhodoferax sp.]MBP9736647.1 4Fe-4S dicluster domain-containing protein [Rhodoferax sp.]